jgi:hypothetical protein
MRLDSITATDDIYNEIKTMAIRLWKTKDNEFGYVDEKLDVIKDLPNSGRNIAKIIKMFDHWHQEVIADRISIEAKRVISDCIKAGWIPQRIGMDLELNPFFKV